ncbi:MAG: T9SS type A sorting domain-containing protein, partial [Paludibacter sp.]|nr:T9SS type A sorting domain-containing protein [Paludibacter sp.]
AITITGGGGTGAVATASTNASGVITSVNISNPGSGYTSAPTVTVTTPGGGSGFTAGTVLFGTGAITPTLPTQYSNLTISNTAGVTLPNDFSVSGTLLVNESLTRVGAITLLAGAKATIDSGKTLTATTLNLNSSASGTATLVNYGTTTITTANVDQYLTSSRNWYVSSPVTGATSGAITTATGGTLVSYNEVNGSWPSADATLAVGTGYIAVSPTTSGIVTFSGSSLNTGAQSFTLTRSDSLVQKRGFNLIGNPYPSYVNWQSATRTKVGPTMWYRSKNDVANGGAYTFATFGAVSGEGTSVSGIAVTGLIPPMQGFWVRVSGTTASESGSVAFDNTMRSHAGATSTMLKAPTMVNANQQVLRLQVSNGINSDEAIVLFNENATNGMDDFDSPKMTNANALVPEIYTIVGNEQLVINGLNNIPLNTELPLGFTTGQSNTFSIKATEFRNFDVSTRVYLKDNVMGTEQELTVGTSYSFSSAVESTSTRFSLVFKSAGVTTDLSKSTEGVVVFKNTNNQIVVNCKGTVDSEASVSVYNEVGQKLTVKRITSSKTVLDNTFTPGVYIVSVKNGFKTISQKITLN